MRKVDYSSKHDKTLPVGSSVVNMTLVTIKKAKKTNKQTNKLTKTKTKKYISRFHDSSFIGRYKIILLNYTFRIGTCATIIF